jgi:hypothetical protein
MGPLHQTGVLRMIDDDQPQRQRKMTPADRRLIERIHMFRWQAPELEWLLRDPALLLLVVAVIRTRLREVERGTEGVSFTSFRVPVSKPDEPSRDGNT